MVTIYEKQFQPYIEHNSIIERVGELGNQITNDYQQLAPVFLPVLNGAFMFASDLMKQVHLECELHFLRYKSYSGMQTTGKVSNLLGLPETLKGKDAVIIEDIVDTGKTINRILEDLKPLQLNSIKICTLLHKPDAMQTAQELDYIGFSIPNKFVVGYGLDYDGLGRNLKDIHQVTQ